jgi:hypothetical protein
MIRLLIAITLLIPIFSFAPEDWNPVVNVAVDADKMICDNIGNTYFIKAETISKYDSAGVLQKTFSNKNFGPITSADATNALRIVLFYKDFNRIVILDNTLSQNGDAIQLEAVGFPLATLAASSHDNGIWVYDQQNFELVRLNRNLQVEQRTGNLSQLLGTELQPNFIIEKDNRLFLNNPATGILVFDIFGTYSKTIPLKSLKEFQVVDNNIIYFQDSAVSTWDMITANDQRLIASSPKATSVLLQKNKMFVLEDKHFLIYNR